MRRISPASMALLVAVALVAVAPRAQAQSKHAYFPDILHPASNLSNGSASERSPHSGQWQQRL